MKIYPGARLKIVANNHSGQSKMAAVHAYVVVYDKNECSQKHARSIYSFVEYYSDYKTERIMKIG